MFRRTYTATLHASRPISDEPSVSGPVTRLYLHLEPGAIIEVSSRGGVAFVVNDGRFIFDPAEFSAGFHDPFALDRHKSPAQRAVDVEIYVPVADGPREHPTPVYVESHAPGAGGFDVTFAHRPSETVYRTVTLPDGESDPLLDEQVTVPPVPDGATVLENVATGVIEVVTEETIAAATDQGHLTTILPAEWSR